MTDSRTMESSPEPENHDRMAVTGFEGGHGLAPEGD